jgi:hypothetical protein
VVWTLPSKRAFLRRENLKERKKMKSLFLLPGAAALLLSAPLARADDDLKLFKTESGAQTYCPKDTVVWGSLESGVFYYKGRRHYGTTKDGHYLCMEAAIKAKMEPGGNDK